MNNYVLSHISLLALGLLTMSSASCSPAGEAGEGAQSSAPKGGGGASPMMHSGTAGSLNLAVGSSNEVAQGGGASEKICQALVREGERVPVDMYFLVDSSGSMGEGVAGGRKWEVVSSALVSFLNDPRNSGTGVGIGYFPSRPQTSCAPGQAGCLCIPIINLCFATEGGSCATMDYAKPSVPMALPPPIAAVISDIGAHSIGGGTPTRPAVEGALQYLSQWADAHPDRKPLLVLATDGEPIGCAANAPRDVASVAAAALAGPHQVQTFVIGVGASLGSLDLVAQAGGTDRAFLVDTGGDVAKEFADALDKIRGAAHSCDFKIPDGDQVGEKIDPSKVNVSYTESRGAAPLRVAQAFMGDPLNCDSSGGWYYDNPSAPRLIKLCDATCKLLGESTIHVEFGCDTIVRPPR